MAIVEMKRLTAVIPEKRRAEALNRLMHLGCVEIVEPGFPGEPALRPDTPETAGVSERLLLVQSALEAARTVFGTEKRGLFSPRRALSTALLSAEEPQREGLALAEALQEGVRRLKGLEQERQRLATAALLLEPWRDLPVPMEGSRSRWLRCLPGSCPLQPGPEALAAGLGTSAPRSALLTVGQTADRHCLLLVCPPADEPLALAGLLKAGFQPEDFGGRRGAVPEALAEDRERLAALEREIGSLRADLQRLADRRGELETLSDILSAALQQEAPRSRLLRTGRTVVLEGWMPADSEAAVTAAVQAIDGAWSCREPREGEEAPVAFRQHALARPFGIIAELYGTPRYDSRIDPTPYMAPFFCLFFGLMVADGAYGIVLALTALWLLRRQQEEGFMRRVAVLVLYCGLSTLLCGALFGSWFGDFTPAVTRMLTGTALTVSPLWFDPLKQPMDMLLFAFSLGGLQLLTGLSLSGWRQVKQGRWFDAVCDSGLWILLLMGLLLMLLKLPAGSLLAALGAGGIVLTAGRRERSPLLRLMRGFLALYGVTGYLADVLSYSRLLALGLASGVIASVINAMSTLGGPTPGGILALLLIFAGGHSFNLAINLVGAYVHASRLQYVEFFSKFYEGGGRPFRPFALSLRYTRLEKED